MNTADLAGMPLTPKQRAVYDFIQSSPYPPTREEMARHFGWKSPNSAECHVRLMQRKGVLAVDEFKARGLRCLPIPEKDAS